MGGSGLGLAPQRLSIVDAVKCAIARQQLFSEDNADMPGDRRMGWRIGIDLGDVLVEGDDIFGDGVNIAAQHCQRFDGSSLSRGIAPSRLCQPRPRLWAQSSGTDKGELGGHRRAW